MSRRVLTPAEVRVRVEGIRASAHDYEAAHGAEDELYVDVLKAIAAGRCSDETECASEALKAADIDFARHCA